MKGQVRKIHVLVISGLGGICFLSFAVAGSLEPATSPGPTMYTLSEVYNRPVWRMSEKVFVDWPSNSRFAVCDNGTSADPNDDMVLDKDTGLIWARNADILDANDIWIEMVRDCRRNVTLGGRLGWRLPTVEELSSLLDTSNYAPRLSTGHPFVNVHSEPSDIYWTATTYEDDSQGVWGISMYLGIVFPWSKTDSNYLWAVWGGNAYASGNW